MLHLFLNNPSKSFYVREITRLVDEQINSVRRELANMLEVGIVSSETVDNKLYYRVNQRYEFYTPFRAIFGDDAAKLAVAHEQDESLTAALDAIKQLKGVTALIVAGVLVDGSVSPVDMIVAGSFDKAKLARLVARIEKTEGRDINYATLTSDELYYRLSVRDRFIAEVVDTKHDVLVDKHTILTPQKEQK